MKTQTIIIGVIVLAIAGYFIYKNMNKAKAENINDPSRFDVSRKRQDPPPPANPADNLQNNLTDANNSGKMVETLMVVTGGKMSTTN